MKKQNKKALIYLLVACGIVGTGVSGYYFGKYQSEQNQDKTQEVNVIQEKGIILKQIQTDTGEGDASTTNVFNLTYTVNPVSFNGQIDVSIDWTQSRTELINDYYSVVHNATLKQINITSLKACPAQAMLKVFSKENPSIYAQASVDYKQRITGASVSYPDSTKVLGGVDCFNVSINKTVGSLENNTSAYEYTGKMYFTEDFSNWVIAQMKVLYPDAQDSNIMFDDTMLSQYSVSNKKDGLFNVLISNDVQFTSTDLFSWIWFSGNRGDLTRISSSALTSYFSEEKAVFDIEVLIDGSIYLCDVFLKMVPATITSIQIDSSSIVF